METSSSRVHRDATRLEERVKEEAANVASTVRSQARRAEANIHDAVHRMAEEVHAGSFNFNLYTGVLFLEGFFLLALAIACLAFPHQLASLTQYMAKWGSWEQIHFTGLVLKSNTSFLLMRAVGSLLLGSAAVLLRAAYLNDVKFRTYVFIGQCVSGAAFALASSIPSSYGTVIPVPLLSSMILIPTLLLGYASYPEVIPNAQKMMRRMVH